MRTIDPRISSELDRLVARMFAKNPEERPRDALEVAVELERLASREAPSLPSASAVALTPDEQLPVSVVVVAAHTLDADTIVAPVEASEVLLKPVAAPMERDAVVALAESFGGVAETLANGALVVVFEGSTNARDQCMRAARCALRLKSLVPERTVVLASGRGRSSGGSIVGEAIDRAVHCLRGEVGEGVRVEQASIQLLEPRFEVMRDGPLRSCCGSMPRRSPHVRSSARQRRASDETPSSVSWRLPSSSASRKARRASSPSPRTRASASRVSRARSPSARRAHTPTSRCGSRAATCSSSGLRSRSSQR